MSKCVEMSIPQMLGGILIAVGLISRFIPMPSFVRSGQGSTLAGILLLLGIILLTIHVGRQPDKTTPKK